jgi:hypothetical protein
MLTTNLQEYARIEMPESTHDRRRSETIGDLFRMCSRAESAENAERRQVRVPALRTLRALREGNGIRNKVIDYMPEGRAAFAAGRLQAVTRNGLRWRRRTKRTCVGIIPGLFCARRLRPRPSSSLGIDVLCVLVRNPVTHPALNTIKALALRAGGRHCHTRLFLN